MNRTIKRLQDEVKAAQLALLEAQALDAESSLRALQSTSFLNEESGERILDPTLDYMMSEEAFLEYLAIKQEKFAGMGIEASLDRVYTHRFEVALKSTENALLDACAKVMPVIGKKAIADTRNHWKGCPELVALSLKLDASTLPAFTF